MKISKRRDEDIGVSCLVPILRIRAMIRGVVLGLLASQCLSHAEPGIHTKVVVSNLAELNQAAVMEEAFIAELNIEGTVWWSSRTEGRIILKDDTSVLQLELDVACQMPALGDRLVLEGNGLVVKTRDVVKLSSVPVVENGGLHPPEEKSGTIHLNAGRHPIRVIWFNRTDRYGLEVSWEGPGIIRQPIPDTGLFHLQPDSGDGSRNFLEGLHYRYCEGSWWRRLPNFNHIPAVKTGVVDNFDIEVRNRDNHIGLQFSGYVDVPKDGQYTFYVLSDDGSRLFIGDSSFRIRTDGTATLPAPHPGAMHKKSMEGPEFQWSEIEGSVTAFHRSHGALEVDVMTKLGLVRCKVAEDSDRSYTLRPRNRIRAAGVGRRVRNLDGSWTFGVFFVQHWNEIEQQYIIPSIWNEYPQLEISSLMALEPSNMVESVVHVSGRLEWKGPGLPMVLDDGSGQIFVEGVTSNALLRSSVDLLGQLDMEGSNLVLRCPHFRQFGEVGPEENGLPLLTTAEQVCQLSLEEAARNYPVRIKGVITSPNEYDGAVLHDSSRGIYLSLVKPADVPPEDWEPIAVQIGDYCEIEGVTAPYEFDPYILVSRLKKLGAVALPAPVRPTWDQLINGSLHCNYVELEGVVASMEDHAISLLTRDGRINVRLNPIGPGMPHDSLGATVRLRGCLLAEWDGESRQVVVGSIYLDQHRVTMVHPAPVDPFAIPLKQVGDLLQFDPQAGALQRVKVSGQLIYQDEQASYLMDGESGLCFIPVETGAAQVGDRLEVVGFVDLSGASPLLQDAVVRRLEPAGLPMPRKLDSNELVHDEYDATLVQVDGVLLDTSSRPDGIVFEIQSGLRRFMAMLDDQTGMDPLPAPGSHLELTGVYVGQGGNRVLGRPIDSFQLLLNSAGDIHVLSRPPWWTLKRLLLVVGLLFGVLSATLVWISLLHRQVEERTQQLGDQIRQRQRVERKRAIEQERARLAHDLHDDLGSGLTEVNMLAMLMISPTIPANDKAHCADEMNKLLSRMVLSLDEIVWAENPKNDSIASLAGYFSAHAQRLLGMASVSCGLDVAEDLPDQPLDPKFRQELFLAFKEAITNVVKHAKAKKVWLRISIQDDELVVMVADDGCGITEIGHRVGADGLGNMRDRMSALGGHCEIQSDPGTGTTVRLQAPIRRDKT